MTDLTEPAATGQTRLSEAIVKALPIPSTGNKVYYFAGAILQGQPAPRGFGVRVTAAGVKIFVLNYRIKGREYRYTIGRYPEWSALRAVRQARDLRQRIDRGENPLDDRAPVADGQDSRRSDRRFHEPVCPKQGSTAAQCQ